MRQTNTQFIKNLMNNNPIMQAFVIEALHHYSDEMINAELPQNGLISAEAWRSCANEALTAIEAHFQTV